MPNFSNQLAQYSQAIANRKTRREIKKRQEEAEAARKAASNARSNNGLISTLGGAAGAAAANYFLPGSGAAGMAMGYQLGSSLAGGVNSIVKPYNSQEIAGMPYTQPSGWEQFNQVAPQVASAYGAYQQNQAKLQQDEYTNSINNILNLTKIGDLNPAATTEMIGKLNDQHTAKYELDSPTGYMMNVSTLDSLGTGDKGWSVQKASFATDIEGGIARGDVASIEALQDSNLWQYHKGVSYDEAIRQAQTNKAALGTKASDAQLGRANQQAIMANRIMDSFDELPETYFRGEEGVASFKENFMARQDVKAMVQSDPTFVNRITGAYKQKRFELNKPMYEENMETALTALREDKGVTMNYESFRELAVEQLGHSEEFATMLYENAIAGGKGDRAEAFYDDVNKLKLFKIDLFGEETPRDPTAIEREIRYMGKIQGIPKNHIDFAVSQMQEATRTQEVPAGPSQTRPTETVNMSPAIPDYANIPMGEGGSFYNIDNVTTSATSSNGNRVVGEKDTTVVVGEKDTTVGDIVLKYDPNNAAEDLKGQHDMKKGRIIHADESVEIEGSGNLENEPVSPINVENKVSKDVTVGDPPASSSANMQQMRRDQLEELRNYYAALRAQQAPSPAKETAKPRLDLNSVKDPVFPPGEQQPSGKKITDMPPEWKAALRNARLSGDPEAVRELIHRGKRLGLDKREVADLLKVIGTYNQSETKIRSQGAGGPFGRSVDQYMQSRGR
jgi:hypothetical protein